MLSLLLLLTFFFTPGPDKKDDNGTVIPKSIYDFKVEGLEGDTIDFSVFKGRKILIVNTASECGYTPQFEGLQHLYEKYAGKLVIIGFPSDDFNQEPGSNEQISAFCERNYGVTFPMASKIPIKGKDAAPIYHWLTHKKHNGYESSEVKWNFQKYLINEKGELIGIFYSKTKPDNPELVKSIEQAIEE